MKSKEELRKQLHTNIVKAVFIDKVKSLTEVSLMYSGYPYAVGGIDRQDIKAVSNSIIGVDTYINSYGVLCLRF